MASIAWELVRMSPDTTYIVTPWSMRGYESVHGSVTFTLGGLVLIYGLITMLPISIKPLWSRLFALVMAIGAVIVAVLYGGGERTMGGGILGWALALFGGYIVGRAIKNSLPSSLESTTTTPIMLGSVVVSAFLLNLLVFGASRTAQPWLWVAIAAAIAFGLSITIRHPQLSANRMLMLMVSGGWVAIALSAAAARTGLLVTQTNPGDYKDVQVTSGYFIALFGMMIALIGAISMWAKRRDIIITEERAERQRAAAEASAAEIKAALELAQKHQREARAAT
jgi:hypothetical protein